MQKSRKRSSKGFRIRKLWWLAGLVVAVVAGLAALQLSHTTHFFTNKPTTVYRPIVPTGGQNTKGETGAPALGGSGSSSSATTPVSPKSTAGSSNVALTAPTGIFVNTHHPSLTGSSDSNKMFSDCNTTPGASCYISFTNTSTGAARTLTTQAVNGGGAVYWSWTLQNAGLTQGSWKVTATATLNGQSKSTTDAMTLEVGP